MESVPARFLSVSDSRGRQNPHTSLRFPCRSIEAKSSDRCAGMRSAPQTPAVIRGDSQATEIRKATVAVFDFPPTLAVADLPSVCHRAARLWPTRQPNRDAGLAIGG